MRHRSLLLITFVTFWIISYYANAQTEVASLCSPKDEKKHEKAVTQPKAVDLDQIKKSILQLKTTKQELILQASAKLEQTIEYVFDPTKTQTKMEQFYTMLYHIAQFSTRKEQKLHLDETSVRDVLMASAVFTDQSIPNQIVGISIDFQSKNKTRYAILFDKERVKILLNQGKGFTIFRNGKCQHAQSLIFEKEFSFELKKLQNGNLRVKNFSGVDLFGDFGNRGIVDVDINYVALKAVEFYHGSNLGEVTAFVSDQEFQVNQHNFLLKVLSQLVPDKSIQPIDW